MHKIIRPFLALLLGASLFSQPVLAQQADLGPTLNKIAESGNIYLAVREAAIPFSYVLEDKKTPAGYSWDICQRVAKAVEEKLGKPITIVPVIASTSGRMMMVKVGMADIECGSTTNTVGRQRQVAFSNTLFVSEIRIMVRANSGIKDAADLKDKKVVTTSGTSGERLVRQLAMQRNLPIRQMQGRSNFESMRMLERGEVDAFVSDDALLLEQRANSENPQAYVLLPRAMTSVEPYGLVIRNDDPEFKKLVDAVLVQLFKSGEIEKVYDKWFNQAIPKVTHPLNMPLSDLNKAAFANPNDKAGN